MKRQSMKKALVGSVVLVGLTLASSAAALATTIDFGGLAGGNGDPFPSIYTEDGYNVQCTAGSCFQAQAFGGPLPSVFAGPVFSAGTTALTIKRSDGGSFIWNSFDVSPNGGTVSINVNGRLSGSQVFNFATAAIYSGASTFQTISSLFGSLFIDQLIITGTPQVGVSSFNFDNVVLSGDVAPIPVPAALPLLACGLGALGFAGWRRSKNKRSDLAA